MRARALLFNILFAAVTQVAYTRFEVDKGIIDALVDLRKKAGTGGQTTAGEPAPETKLWGMLYADDVGVDSKSPEQLRKCAAFGLTVSEAKTEIMCLRTTGMSDATATFSVEPAGQVYKQTCLLYTSPSPRDS